MNKSMNYMSTSLMDQRQHNSKPYHQKKQTDPNHSIDFNYLTEKLKKLQQQAEQTDNSLNPNIEPTPSLYSPNKTALKYKSPANPSTGDTLERERIKPPSKKVLPRSLSNLDKHNNIKSMNQINNSTVIRKSSENRSQSQLNNNNNQNLNKTNDNNRISQTYDDTNDLFTPSRSLQNGLKETYSRSRNSNNYQHQSNQKQSLLRNSLQVQNMKQYVQHTKKMSESLRSNSQSSSASETSRSENLSFQSESLVSISCTSRSSSSSPKNRKDQKNNEMSKHIIKRGVSSLGVPGTNKPKIIVIRREKSIACQSSNNQQENNFNYNKLGHQNLKHQSKAHHHHHQMTKSHKKSKPTNEEHLIMKQNLLASLSIPSQNVNSINNDMANNSSHSTHNQVTSTSSTTSGVELSSKNSTSGQNSAHGDGSTENLHHIVKKSMETDDSEAQKLFDVKELKNRIFIMELELDNQSKKLIQEKEQKRKQIAELKSRYDSEKSAALKALEAKLNAEKLFELNKLKEENDLEKRDETDLHQRSFDSELLNLKLKVREKSEKCLKLEKMLKEEQNKNSQLFTKSMEIVKKYNQEIKNFKGSQKVSTFCLSTQTQTDNLNLSEDFEKRQTALKDQLSHIQYILELESGNGKHIIHHTVKPNTNAESNLSSIVHKIEQLATCLKSNLENVQHEVRSLHKQNDKLNDEFRVCKETKAKLESLYKIKCKSDLNKSAQIKKSQLNYELELMKFHNDFNSDLVQHLEAQISTKESHIFEQNNQLENISGLIEDLSTLDLPRDCLTSVNRIKDSIQATNRNLRNNLREGGSNKSMSPNVKVASKKFVPSVLFNRIHDENESDKSSEAEKNLLTQEKVYKLDKQLDDMKIANKKLIIEKQELMNQLNENIANKSSNSNNLTVIETPSTNKQDPTDLLNSTYNCTFNSRLFQVASIYDRRKQNPLPSRRPSNGDRDYTMAKAQHSLGTSNDFTHKKSASPVNRTYSKSNAHYSELNLVKEKQNQSAPI